MDWEYGVAVDSRAVSLPVPAPFVDGAFLDGGSGGAATVPALNPATELWEVAGATHVAALSTAPEQYERKVVEWFRTHP